MKVSRLILYLMKTATNVLNSVHREELFDKLKTHPKELQHGECDKIEQEVYQKASAELLDSCLSKWCY